MFGQRLRHLRRRACLTLEELGRAAGKPASYLSQLENGHREPRLSTVAQLATALRCDPAELLATSPPSRRAELEVSLARYQTDPLHESLRLPHVRPGARLDDAVLETLVTLYRRVEELSAPRPIDVAVDPFGAGIEQSPATGGARVANAAMRDEMRRRNNYFEEIEAAAREALRAVAYPGSGAVSERNLTDVAAHFGFTVARVQDLPQSTRSISDMRARVIYVPQRNATGGSRSTRSVIAQTLGRFALDHAEPADFAEYVRQRVETNYFSGALLAPEVPFVRALAEAKARQDISVEDLNEMFYVSYEMAAHRLTNLITRHFDIAVHFQRSDPEGILWKAYENDGVAFPSDSDGTVEGQRLCRWWSSRQAFDSEDSYALHYQYTDTPAGSYWCATHIDLDRDRGDAVTIGTSEAYARWFRGSETARRMSSTCPDPSCCRKPPEASVARWDGIAWPSAADRSHFVSGLPRDTMVFSPYPGVDLTEVHSFLDRRRSDIIAPSSTG
jgi:predicted transcriptional regulator/transcriptional regulator with XRE-family HTH domain